MLGHVVAWNEKMISAWPGHAVGTLTHPRARARARARAPLCAGPLKPEITVKFFAVAFIFFTSGLTLRTEELKRAVMQVKVHTFIQGFSMLLIPAVVTQFVYLLDSYTDLSKGLLRGLLVVSCLPPPVSSAAILTRAGGGNEAAAIFNSAFGSFLGIFATPALFMVVVGVSGEVPAMKIVYDLSRTVIVPLVVGQVLRVSAWDRIKGLGIPFSQMAQITLLLIIYSAFCDMFSRKLDIDQRSLVAVLVIVVGMLCTFTVAAFSIARALGYAAEDVVCIMFCSTHKSLTLGLPILKIVFGGDPMLPIMSLPILAYHPCQIFFGGLLVPVVTSWMDKQRRKLKDSKDVRGNRRSINPRMAANSIPLGSPRRARTMHTHGHGASYAWRTQRNQDS